MKKFSLFFTFFICFLCVVPVKAEEKKQGFYFGWENDLHEFSEELNENDLIGVILGDNLAFGDNTVIISTDRKTVETEETTEFVSSIKLEIRDKNGKKIVDSVIEDSVFFGGIVKDDYLYMCVYKNIKDATENSDDNLYLLKINNKLEIVKSLKFDESFSSDNGVLMILTGISGYNMFTVDDEKIYVLDYENGILSTSFDLDSWNIEFEFPEINTEDSSEIPEEVKENVLSELSKYFPDLSKEINSILELTKKTGNLEDVPDFDFDIDITTHIYEDLILSSGGRFLHERFPQTTEPVNESINDALKKPSIELITDALGKNVENENSIPIVSLIKLADSNGNVIFDKINENYLLFLDATVIGNYIVALGVPMSITSGDVSLNSVDIVIFNMNGDVIQTIENDGIYLKLNENNNGFAVTNIKVCLSDVVSKDGNSEETTQQTLIPCGFNTKAYYLNLNIDTKVTGKGSIKVMGGSRKGESVTFEIEPEEGYVLDFVKVIDAKGNVLTFKDYSFTMPSADVTIEANFLPENPSTFDGIFGSIVIAIVSMSCALGFTVLLNNVRKEEII